MSQEEILKVLEENDFTRKEIQERLHLCMPVVIKSLRQLIKYQEIIRKYRDDGIPIYGLKKRKAYK